MSAARAEQIKPDVLTREMWQVAGKGDVGRVEQILAQGADVNASDRAGVTALMRAAYHGQLPMVNALVEHGADLNATDSDGLTALMLAKHLGREEIVNALLSRGAEEVWRQPLDEALPVGSTPEEAFTSEPSAVADGPDDYLAEVQASKNPKVRTLHEPPEIWELVHTTQPASKSRSISAGRLISAKTLVLAAIALVIGAGALFGFMNMRGSGSAADETPARRQQTLIGKKSEPKTPRSSQSQPRAATVESVKTDEPKKTTAPLNQTSNIAPSGNAKGVRAIGSNVSLAAPVALSPKKPAAKPRKNARSGAPVFIAEEGATPKSTASNRGKVTNSTSVKKEVVKAPSQPQPEPPKANTPPKPKVINWP